MSDLRKQWAIVQKRVPPPTHWRKHKNALTSWKVAYAELVAALPRPIRVRHYVRGRFDLVGWDCRICLESAFITDWSTPDAIAAALDHLHQRHGCPNRRTTGEACHTTCIHCHGWQWCATDTERSDW